MNQSKDQIEIRPIQRSDNSAIQFIIKNHLEEVGLDKPGTAYFDPYLGKLFEFYKTEPKGEYWVAIDKSNERVVGGVGIAPFGNYEEIAELQKYYLLKEYQNLGIGRSLFDKAEAYARKNHYKSIYIETMDVLDKANGIYKHYGFKQLEEPLAGSEHGLMNRWFIKNL